MFNPSSRANEVAQSLDETLHARDAVPLSLAIVTDDHTTAQALVAACEHMPRFDCRVRVAALRDEPAQLRAQPDEVLVVDEANAPDRRLDPARYPGSPCVAIVHASQHDDQDAGVAHAHARLLYSDLSPIALELAVRTAQQNCRALTLAQRNAEGLERAALAARDRQRRIVEEIAPIAHALEGLLDIMEADGANTGAMPGATTPTQFGLLRNWTHDLVRTVRRHQDAAGTLVGTRANMNEIVEDAVALLRTKCDGLGHTVVLSIPAEPVMVCVDPRRLQSAVRQLMESSFEREARDRRIDIVLWRSMDECRLVFVSGPPVRRGVESIDACEPPPPVRPASLADASFIGALAQLRELGAVVESSCVSAFGSSLLVSLPIA